MGRHRAPSRWRRNHPALPAAAALGTAAAALTASTAPPAFVSSAELTTGSLPVVPPQEDPPTVVLPRLNPAEVAAEVLETARQAAPIPAPIPAPAKTPVKTPETTQAKTPRHSAPATGSLQQRIVQAAHSYVGKRIPYRYGGKTCTASAGCDCSALVWRVFQDAGMDVGYRNSTALKRWTTPVSRANAVPGDLVLFPGHVGIYVGQGMMVDHGGPGKGANYRKIWGHPTFGRVPGLG